VTRQILAGIVLGVGAALAPVHAQAPAQVVPVEVVAQLRDGPRVELRFIVKSNSDEPMRYFVDGLPWGVYGAAAIVVATPTGETLDPEAPIEDPGPAIAVLQPRQEVRGSIDLTARFPSLKKRRRETDLLVFWSYEFWRTMPEGEAKRAGGWLLLPRSR